MGVGTIIGAGIFVTTGVAAAENAGPAIVLSFVLAGVVCVLVALCYSELAAMVPVSGSAYTYTYATLGEVPAFLVGWNLLLELVVAGAAIAISWSGMLSATLKALFGIGLPASLSAAPADGGIVNLPAVLILALVGALLLGEVRLTARVTKALVALTVLVLLVLIVVGIPHIDTRNWVPFAPFGARGVIGGAAVAFFAFLGFDVVATSAEESRHPQRDLPFAIIASVVVASIFYVAVSAVLTGVAPYRSLDNETPVATAFGTFHLGWVGGLVLAASVVALTKGLLMITYGQTRLAFAMCRDGLLPAGLARAGRRSGAPVRLAVLLACLGSLIAGFLPITVVAELVNIGALCAFAVVCVGVVVLRRLEPERERPFRTPWVPVTPTLGLIGCVVLATTLAPLTWVRFAVWLVVGVATYLVYGRQHSALHGPSGSPPATTPPPTPAAGTAEGEGA